jgi:predicted dehydrogenase
VRLGIAGRLTDEPGVRVGFIGCGSHAFRNVFPTLQFVPAELVAVCDLEALRAQAFAKQFGAGKAYCDHREMLAHEKLDAVLVVTNYDERGRPRYPDLACDALAAGCHVWIEKPPAASTADVARMRAAAIAAGKHVAVGFKKMFMPANEKAKELMALPDFGTPTLMTLQYPQSIPTADEITRYLGGDRVGSAVSFLDHLCHPGSLLVYLAGMPRTLAYEKSPRGGGVATFTFASGLVASLSLTGGAANNGGMERTMIVSDRGRHILVEDNLRVSYHRNPPGLRYGESRSYYAGGVDEVIAAWQPEHSLGQLYNKGLFELGYFGELEEFCRSILEHRAPAKGTLDDAYHVTRLFECFGQGPGKTHLISEEKS